MCVCAGMRVCVCEICVCIGNIYTSAEIPKTQILKKHLLLFVKRFIYIHIYCAGRCLWALHGASEGDALAAVEAGQRESSVVCVCAWAVVAALLTHAWLDREVRPVRGPNTADSSYVRSVK